MSTATSSAPAPSMPGSPGAILGVWAHPDDEAYLSAGLMRAAVVAGNPVAMLTATCGEQGTSDPDGWPPARLADLRRRELAASLLALGVTEHELLGLADGGLADLDPDVGAELVRRTIDRTRPDTIVTFGPEGMTGHPDHRAVSAWTTAAWRATGRRARLWYATLTPAFHDIWGRLNDSIGLWADVEAPPCTPAPELAHTVELAGDALDRKVAALRAHASQTAALEQLVGEATFRRWWATETFVAAG